MLKLFYIGAQVNPDKNLLKNGFSLGVGYEIDTTDELFKYILNNITFEKTYHPRYKGSPICPNLLKDLIDKIKENNLRIYEQFNNVNTISGIGILFYIRDTYSLKAGLYLDK